MKRPHTVISILLLLITPPAQASCQSRKQEPGSVATMTTRPAAVATPQATPTRKPTAQDDPFQESELPPEVEQSLTPLMKAAWGGEVNTVRELLDGGADVNEKAQTGLAAHMGLTALLLAARRGDLATVKALLAAGAKTDPNPDTDEKDEHSALTLALRPGNREVVEALLDAGAVVNPRQGPGMTPLIYAIALGVETETVKLLIERGADVNAAMRHNGATPLMAAADNPQIAQLLIGAGADINAKDKSGWTALSWATEKQSEETVQLLKRAGAKQ